MVYTEYIGQILDQVEQNPTLARKSLRTAWEKTTAEEFRSAAVPLMMQREGTAQRFLVSFLLQYDTLELRLADHQAFTKEEAVALAKVAQRLEPSLDVKLAMQLASKAVEDERDARRILDVLEAIAQPANLLPLISNIMQHPNAKVRSKAALLMGKGNRNAAWVTQQLGESDDRVRANAVESLWGMDGEEACAAFLRASRDRNQRTAINGMLGLYLCGRVESLQLLAEASHHPSNLFRASSAWGMGRTQDPRFLPVLAKLVRDADSLVRSNALKAMGKIRAYRSLVEKQGSFKIRIGAAVCLAGGRREICGVVRGPNGSPAPTAPIHYAIEEGGKPLFRYELQVRPDADAALGVVMPHASDLESSMAAALEQAWKTAQSEKRPQQLWSSAVYTNQPDAAPGAKAGFLQAAYELFHQLPHREHRALMIVGSPMSESSNVMLSRITQLEKLSQEAQRASVRICALVPPVCSPIMRAALADLTRATRGRLLEVRREETIGELFASVLLTAFPTFQLRYETTDPAAARVRLAVHAPTGFGECEAHLIS